MCLAPVAKITLGCVQEHSSIVAQIMRENYLLHDNIHVLTEEQLAISLHIVRHKSKNRMMVDFIGHGKTISRYFNKILGAICILRDQFMKHAHN